MARYHDKQTSGTTAADGELLVRQRPVFRQADAEKWGNWEGKIITQDVNDSEPSEICFVADLFVLADQIGGSGLLAGADIDVSISGSKAGDEVSLEIYIDYAKMAREPFLCSGTVTSNEAEMSGTWHTTCWSPDDCGCEGLNGQFELVRRD